MHPPALSCNPIHPRRGGTSPLTTLACTVRRPRAARTRTTARGGLPPAPHAQATTSSSCSIGATRAAAAPHREACVDADAGAGRLRRRSACAPRMGRAGPAPGGRGAAVRASLCPRSAPVPRNVSQLVHSAPRARDTVCVPWGRGGLCGSPDSSNSTPRRMVSSPVAAPVAVARITNYMRP